MSTRKRKQEAAAEEGEEEEELQALPSDESEEEEEYVDSGPEDSGANWRRAMRMRRKLMMLRGRKMNPKTRREKGLRQKLKPNRKLRRKRLRTRTRRKRNNPVFPTSTFSLRSIDVRDIIIVHMYFHSTIFCSFSQKNIFGKGKGKTKKAESN
ncbi:unnamed protein product [Tuber melanosporum]|uniref:(Perigord truffle) hypothetical protein n=1 Tax=Tuber melanosporum (strain Mel28) TaxID=656061 RepID=D5G701_TUBMM|nr:uncharacterized protein GSTUM_00004527001 [Tuber melanosporum]CAZ80294.1 unnamed protein product [Tuber melanosporum]